ncbi:MAG: CDP-alcohol phosphatidyltransferase family protein [Candidatus Heimdallarchaeota archaeon]
MIDKWLSKTKLNQIFEKFVRKLFYKKISANQLTILALSIGLLSALSIFLSGFLIWKIELVICAAILMGISFFIDVLDGALARIEEPTIFGGILDIFSDRTVEVFIIISLISTDPLILMWPGILSLGAIVLCISMFLLVGGAVKAEDLEETKKVIYYRAGLMERSETLIFLLLVIILIPLRSIILWIFFFLVMITALLRLRDAYIIFKISSLLN